MHPFAWPGKREEVRNECGGGCGGGGGKTGRKRKGEVAPREGKGGLQPTELFTRTDPVHCLAVTKRAAKKGDVQVRIGLRGWRSQGQGDRWMVGPSQNS